PRSWMRFIRCGGVHRPLALRFGAWVETRDRRIERLVVRVEWHAGFGHAGDWQSANRHRIIERADYLADRAGNALPDLLRLVNCPLGAWMMGGGGAPGSGDLPPRRVEHHGLEVCRA